MLKLDSNVNETRLRFPAKAYRRKGIEDDFDLGQNSR